jgi:sigma-E factor negative regulatory protein RseB
MLTRGLLSFVLISFVTGFSASSRSDDSLAAVRSAEVLLADMARALRQQNYSGVFTYEHGGTLDAFKVSHQHSEHEKLARLEFLNGPENTIERRGVGQCLSVVEHLEGNETGLARYYQFYLKGSQRVAGRMAQVVHLVPRDEYRHGYTVFIDNETSLPLLLMTVNNRRRVLERIQFSDLTVSRSDDPVAPQDAVVETVADDCSGAETQPESWQLNWIPDGFALTAHRVHEKKGDSLTFSDGMASFSVFVQPHNPSLGYQGSAQRGASLVMMLHARLQGALHVVSVVGEIPGVTAERIAAGIGPRKISLGSP